MMVWNRVFDRRKATKGRLRKNRRERLLQLERMEQRQLLAVDMGAITGVAFVDELETGLPAGNPPVLVDAGGNLVAPGTIGATGIEVKLFEDTNTDGLFDVGDVQLGSTTTELDGAYRFDDLAAGTYFVQQQLVPQLQEQPASAVDVVNAAGIQTSLIDDYSLTSQTVTATAGATETDSVVASEVIGGARDVIVTNASTSGTVSVLIEDVPNTLSIGSLNAAGTATIQYDGNDNSEVLDVSGLGGESLAGGGVNDPVDPNTGLVVLSRADLAGDSLEITVYTDAVNFSTATVVVPQDSVNLIESLVPFSDFTATGGTGANFNNVGAIEASLTLLPNTDVTVSIVESRTPDPVAQNFSNTILPQSDLSITKIDLVDPAVAGTQLSYQLQVSNAGPETADGVVVTDQLPGSVVFISGDLQGDSAAVTDLGNGQIQIDVGSLPSGQSATINLVVEIAADFSGTLTNNASVVSSPDGDVDSSNNATSEDTLVNRVVDVGVVKTVVGTPVAGEAFTYSIVVSNTGPSQAADVLVDDVLDSSLSFVAGSFDPNASGVTLSQNGQALQFDVGVLLPGQSETLTFDVLVDTAGQGNLDNTATISTTDTDSNSANDSSTASVIVQREVDLVLTKSIDLSTVVPGQDQVTYTFTVSHASGSVSDASNVVVTDVIPNGLIGTAIEAPTADSTDFSNGVVTVGFTSLPLGESRTFTIVADVDGTALGSITNSGSVSSSIADMNPEDNTDAVTTTAQPNFDLVVVKTVDVAEPSPTETVIYTITVQNQGPSAAQGVVLTDAIPAGLNLVSAAFNGLAGTSDGTTVAFPSTTIDGGSTLTATLEFTVDANSSGILTNLAQVNDLTAVGELTSSNNSDSADINVIAITDLQVQKSVSASRTLVGSDLVYEVTVSNLGPSPAINVAVVDTLPAGITFVSGLGPNGEALSETGGIVTYDTSQLSSGESFQLIINAVLNTGVTATQTNIVSVTSETLDSDPSNNTAVASTSVDPATSSFSGLVFLDINNNGQQDVGEFGLQDVVITISGSDFLGNSINESVLTDSDGRYSFQELAEGVYQVNETQPVGFRDGLTLLGTGATAQAADNVFLQIGLGAEVTASNFDFTEIPKRLSKRSFLASS